MKLPTDRDAVLSFQGFTDVNITAVGLRGQGRRSYSTSDFGHEEGARRYQCSLCTSQQSTPQHHDLSWFLLYLTSMPYSNDERPFPSHWHPSRVLPSVLPRRSIESDFLLTPIRHHVPRCYPRIHEALSAPSLTGYDTYGTARQKSPHFMHALRGDSTVRMALVREGERRGLGLHATAVSPACCLLRAG